MKLEDYRRIRAQGGDEAVLKELERQECRRNRIKEAEATVSAMVRAGALTVQASKLEVLNGEKPAKVYTKLLPQEQQKRSYLEEMLEEKLWEAGLGGWVTEFAFAPGRKFSADFAWPEARLLVECEGNVHRIKTRFRRDIEKYNLATLLSWRLLRFTRREIQGGLALEQIRQLLGEQVG